MGEKRRRAFSAEFKASVALDALSKSASVAEIAQRHGLHPNVVLAWRERLKTFAPQAFAPAGSQNASAERLQREVDFLARALDRVRDSSAGR